MGGTPRKNFKVKNEEFCSMGGKFGLSPSPLNTPPVGTLCALPSTALQLKCFGVGATRMAKILNLLVQHFDKKFLRKRIFVIKIF